VAGAAILAGVATLGAPSSPQAADTIPILLCPFGCGPMAGDTILMNQLIKAGSDVILLPQETPGYMYNIREMGRTERKWKSSIFKTEDTLIQVAYAGGSKEMKEFLPEPVKIPWKILYGETWWGQGKFLGTFDCSLKTMSDLKGKSFAFGDLYSTIGRYLAQNELIKNKVTPDTLSHFKYFERHDSVGVALVHKKFDAGALKNSTYQKLLENGMQLKSILQIKTPTKPWIASSKLDPDTANAIEQVLLTLSPLNIDNNSGFSFLSYDKSVFKHLKNIILNKRHF
jgi:hypothetical protein